MSLRKRLEKIEAQAAITTRPPRPIRIWQEDEHGLFHGPDGEVLTAEELEALGEGEEVRPGEGIRDIVIMHPRGEDES